MTNTEFQALRAKCEPTEHPAVQRWVITDYHEAINWLASINPEGRKMAMEVHGRLRPGDSRLKHLMLHEHEHGLLYCGSFFREHKRHGGKRHTITWVILLSDESGALYAGNLAAEHRRAYHETINEIGAVPAPLNPD
jgi:hypothetical protein